MTTEQRFFLAIGIMSFIYITGGSALWYYLEIYKPTKDEKALKEDEERRYEAANTLIEESLRGESVRLN